MDDKDTLNLLRDWAIDLIEGDDTAQWGTHAESRLGNQAMRIIDNKPDGIWNVRTHDWYVR